MDGSIEVQRPNITNAYFSTNPANINSSITISVVVTDETVVLDPEIWYSGELYAGEVF